MPAHWSWGSLGRVGQYEVAPNYRFWRDAGFVVGALIAGIGADVASPSAAILIVAALTAASGLVVASTNWQARPTFRPVAVE